MVFFPENGAVLTLYSAVLTLKHQKPTSRTIYARIIKTAESLIIQENHTFRRYGTDGARTHDLSRVRRTLIPAELRFPVFKKPAILLMTGK